MMTRNIRSTFSKNDKKRMSSTANMLDGLNVKYIYREQDKISAIMFIQSSKMVSYKK